MAHLDQEGSTSRNTNFKTRCYCFTWNNYTEDDIKQIINLGSDGSYIFGEEIGEQGTPHLQGVIKFNTQRSFNSLKKRFPKVHWEACRNWHASKKYCSKDGKTFSNIVEEQKKPSLSERYDTFMKKKYANIKWRGWQQAILNEIETEPDDRTILWYWENTGNIGKSFLARYIEWKYKTIIIGGKKTDVFNGVKTYLESTDEYPDVIILDIPRTDEEFVSYAAIEKIKDGIFYSGKYEGGVVRLLPCHVIILANFPPDQSKMSADRWKIKEIN